MLIILSWQLQHLSHSYNNTFKCAVTRAIGHTDDTVSRVTHTFLLSIPCQTQM